MTPWRVAERQMRTHNNPYSLKKEKEMFTIFFNLREFLSGFLVQRPVKRVGKERR